MMACIKFLNVIVMSSLNAAAVLPRKPVSEFLMVWLPCFALFNLCVD